MKRSKSTRYNPGKVKALRTEMAKGPNPAYRQMVAEGNMSDGDMVDFALALANSYFSGILLESFKATAQANMTLQTRRAVLVTAGLFGATAAFDEDSMEIIPLGDDSDLLTFAVQQLVDTGMTVEEAMQQFETPSPAKCQMEAGIHAELPVLEAVH